MNEPTVVLGVTGSVAAYKAVEVARRLIKSGVRVRPVMTEAATRFLGPTTLSGVCGESVAIDMWDPSFAGERHVELAASADAIAIVPATADLLAALAAGQARDLLRCVCLCAEAPIVVAPAMHPKMWDHPATQRNVEILRRDGRVGWVGPVAGQVASGESGWGRMAEPAAIAAAVMAAIDGLRDDLRGRRIVVTAGPTVEDLDPARYLSNRSSGKMGFAIAERAARRGAEVVLIAGPVSLPTPAGVERVDVRSARELAPEVEAHLRSADALIMAAAVADYRPEVVAEQKLKREEETMHLRFVKNPDILATVGRNRGEAERPLLVGFALETKRGEALVEAARGKLERKRVDMVVANHADDSFDRDDNRVLLVERERFTRVPDDDSRLSKHDVGDRVLDWVSEKLR
ncbi:MAG: bifunctional phosphopantothenoylcysteine decarboxylase/phosphopantothenate--cysteine ligase CoaBC [Myxococcota bacterium]